MHQYFFSRRYIVCLAAETPRCVAAQQPDGRVNLTYRLYLSVRQLRSPLIILDEMVIEYYYATQYALCMIKDITMIASRSPEAQRDVLLRY